MKSTVFLLALFALVATCYSAPADNVQPTKKVIYSNGEKGPNDTILDTYTASRPPGPAESNGSVNWGWGRPEAHISYIEILEVGPTKNATAKITSGGVGTNNLIFEALPNKEGALDFEVVIWGTPGKE